MYSKKVTFGRNFFFLVLVCNCPGGILVQPAIPNLGTPDREEVDVLNASRTLHSSLNRKKNQEHANRRISECVEDQDEDSVLLTLDDQLEGMLMIYGEVRKCTS